MVSVSYVSYFVSFLTDKMSSKVVSALLLVCAMAGISVDAATEIKLTASPTNPSEVCYI